MVDQEKKFLQKDDTASLLLKDKNKEKINSMQIKLNQKESDLSKMENLLLEMHKKMDELKQERTNAQSEAKHAVKITAELESELKVVRQEAGQQTKLWSDTIDRLEKQLGDKKVETMKLNMIIEGLERRQVDQLVEIERLQRNQDLGVEDLQHACIDDLVSQERIRHVKQSALAEALNQLKDKDKDRNSLLDEIDKLQQKQKNAYLRLYEKVGVEIDARMHKTLGMREKEIQDEQERIKDLSSNEIFARNLRQQADN